MKVGKKIESLNFAEFVRSETEAIPCAGNQPVLLNDVNSVWLVDSGKVDVFLAEFEDNKAPSFFKHILRAQPGRLLFPLDQERNHTNLGFIVKGLPGSTLRRIPVQRILDKLPKNYVHTIVTNQVNAWIGEFLEASARNIDPRPQIDQLVTAGDSTIANGVLSSDRGLIWIKDKSNHAAFLGTEELTKDETGFIPVSPISWITFTNPTKIEAVTTKYFSSQDLLFRLLRDFHRIVLDAEFLERRFSIVDEANLQVSSGAFRHQDSTSARDELFSLVGKEKPPISDEVQLLHSALTIIGNYEGIEIQFPQVQVEKNFDLESILHTSGVRGRVVSLSKERKWWTGDSGTMLAFLKDNHKPVVLLPYAVGRYQVVDPDSKKRKWVNKEVAESLDDKACLIYSTLPKNRSVNGKDLWKLSRKKLGLDLIQITLAGTGAGIVALLPAIALSILTDNTLPIGDTNELILIAILLTLFAALGLGLNVLRGTATMRVEGKMTARTIAAVWDRLICLPTNFFRRFTAGEITSRAMTFQILRDQFSAIASSALMSVVLLLPTFALLFFYNPLIGWISLFLGLVAFGVTTTLGFMQIGYQRKRLKASRKLSGHLFQLINGIFKLRSSGAEPSAYAYWARLYRQQKLAELSISKFNEHLTAFTFTIPILATTVLLSVIMLLPDGVLSTGDILAIFGVSIVFFVAFSNLGIAFEVVAALIPSFEQIRPIVSALPESAESYRSQVPIVGKIKFDRVSFRYSNDGPLVLNQLSFEANPGEFIAIVGESGSGKSTLVRLALGLEQPSSGTISYDGHDLSRLDLVSVRREVVGVVMQENHLQSGSVLDNIIGLSETYTIKDAWEAARRAAVADDIAAMPMGMYTPMGENSTNFSGGQCQRIRIAAALVRKPSILFLDEATSWLDSVSQSHTMKGIEQSSNTRIVVAHRLSTIRHAHRIYVIKAGSVIQEGSYEELANVEGPFQTFVQRQSA